MSALDHVPFDARLKAPLYQQLYAHLRASILTGRLKHGTRLPSTRGLADELNISRNTVLNAYQQSLAEGYLEGREGSGTYVAQLSAEHLIEDSRRRPGSIVLAGCQRA